MPDPFADAALELFQLAFDEIDACLEGISPPFLNQAPTGSDSNSLAALAVHSLASARSWLCVALGLPLPERDREAEFRARPSTAEELLTLVRGLQADCLRHLREVPRLPWVDLRPAHTRPDAGAPDRVSGAWALMHALEHLREHIGQMWLTRQLLETPS